VSSPSQTLLARLKFLEDHVIKLKKEYPPWAALHFNQLNRGVCFHCCFLQFFFSTKSIFHNPVASSPSHPRHHSSSTLIQYFFYNTIALNESQYFIDYTSI